MNTLLGEFFNLSERLFMTLREGQVPKDELIDSVVKAIDGLAKEFYDDKSLPKELVGVMLDMSTALYSSADGHSEPARSDLYKKFDIVTDKMRDLC